VNTTYLSMDYREVAARYNSINRIPLDAAEQLGQSLAAIAGGARVLDLGAGAGRMAIPARRHGVDVIAIDLERQMLLAGDCEAQDRCARYPAVQGNALHLPFADNSFGVLMINNVLHLVEQWERILTEVRRVLAQGGALLLGRDCLDPASSMSQIRNKWRQIVGLMRPDMRPSSAAGPALPQALARMGAVFEAERTIAEWVQPLRPAQLLYLMAERNHNETWAIDDNTLSAGLPKLMAWAAENLELNKVDEAHWRFVVTVIRGIK
jgi:SAM-dependent methyltransferase